MTNDIKKLLEDMGLSRTEATIYIAGLEVPLSSAQEIAKETGIKRTTVYNAANTLIQKGFAAKHNDGGNHIVLKMLEPYKIEQQIEQNIQLLHTKKSELLAALTRFNKVTSKKTKRAVVAQYDSVEGIKTVVNEALYCKTRTWDIIAPAKNFFSDFDSVYTKYFLNKRTENKIIARSLWEKNPERRILTAEEIIKRNPRFLPSTMHGKFHSVIIIFDDKMAIISSFKEKNAVLIQSQEITETFKALFQSLWLIAEPYRIK